MCHLSVQSCLPHSSQGLQLFPSREELPQECLRVADAVLIGSLRVSLQATHSDGTTPKRAFAPLKNAAVFRGPLSRYVKKNDAHSLLRPETVESLFVLWRVTGEEEWREARRGEGCGALQRPRCCWTMLALRPRQLRSC